MNESGPPHKPYDYLFKRVILRAADRLFSTLFNKRVVGVREIRLDEEQSLIVGRPDVVLALDFHDQSDVLVQLDHQTRDEPELGRKLAKHFVALMERFGKAPIQCVGFLDDVAHKYRHGVTFRSPMGTGMALTFTAFNFSDLSAEWFLTDDDPFGLILAMFCNRARVPDDKLVELTARLAPKMTADETQHFLLSLQLAARRGRINRNTLRTMESFFKGAFTPDLVKEYVMTSPLFAPIIEQTKAEGEAKRRQQIEQIALNLLAMGMSVDNVALATGMDVNEVKKLTGGA
jgi:hypothetical protein